mmetsp:Transcript_96808/g.312632  ORF Transcript_96808/g.312632 Transcript_96808/m.312632 type:complete len:117 (+) Transcript_96808:358-708(+)
MRRARRCSDSDQQAQGLAGPGQPGLGVRALPAQACKTLARVCAKGHTGSHMARLQLVETGLRIGFGGPCDASEPRLMPPGLKVFGRFRIHSPLGQRLLAGGFSGQSFHIYGSPRQC